MWYFENKHLKDTLMKTAILKSICGVFLLIVIIVIGFGIQWLIEVDDSDSEESPINFWLHSTSVGDIAYEEASIIAEGIMDLKNHTGFINLFNIEYEC